MRQVPNELCRRKPAGKSLLHIAAIAICCTALAACEFHYSIDGGDGAPKQDGPASKTNGSAGYVARVATYNIQYLNQDAANQGDRIPRLRQVIADMDPTVVAVQEVDDRAAMELVFPPSDWHVIIDDDSRDRQDVAFAVRKPWKVTNIPPDMDADDEHFLAEGSALESFFPIRRDGLFIHVATPDGSAEFTAINIHAKARVGGRANTAPRRVGSSRVLVEKLKTDLKDRDIVLLGDFNDSPDDASMNVLETGDPNAEAGISREPGTFMINLAEELWDQNMVTQGAHAKRIDKATGLIKIEYPDARDRNIRSERRNVGTGPIMFDQILVSASLKDDVVPGSVEIYRKPIALEGEGYSRTSDHLPMYVDIRR